MTFRPIADDAEVAAFAEILSEAFSAPVERLRARIPQIGLENSRVLVRDGKIAGGFWFIPMGQFFGGRSVPMHGVAAVGVSPDHRGAGIAHQVMAEGMRELRAKGVALSGLYPATQTLYRKSGYEQAGARFEIAMDLDRIRVKDHALSARKLAEGNRPEVEALYRRVAPPRTGWLDRGRYMWERVYEPLGEAAKGYGVWGESGLEGYLYLLHRDNKEGLYNLLLTDFVFASPRAGRRLLTLLAEHASMARRLRWFGGPAEPSLFLLAEQQFTIEARYYWMIRVTHLEAALAARGWPDGLETELHLDLTDDIIPDHNGRFVLRVAGGEGAVSPGGRGDLRLDVRDLAALYSGFLSAEALASCGRVEGTAETLRRATLLFSGPYPFMPDMF